MSGLQGTWDAIGRASSQATRANEAIESLFERIEALEMRVDQLEIDALTHRVRYLRKAKFTLAEIAERCEVSQYRVKKILNESNH